MNSSFPLDRIDPMASLLLNAGHQVGSSRRLVKISKNGLFQPNELPPVPAYTAEIMHSFKPNAVLESIAYSFLVIRQ
jgi:hypothetical protein